jgi:cell division septation protein DedD
MGWLRENWLDVLIFVAFAAVAIGIVFFLTDAGSGGDTDVVAKEPQVSTPAEPSNTEEGPVISVTPTPEETLPLEPDVNAEPASETPAAEPEVVPAPQIPSTGTSVAVGAFGDPANAVDLAAQLRSQGYQVFTAPVGELTRVAVGPYDDPAQAQAASEALAQYQPRVQEITAPDPSAYVAVGNFSDSEARAKASELEAQGLAAVIVSDGNNYSVWVGPVEPGEREKVESQVKTSGGNP